MPTLVEGFVVQNGDTASASYLNTWITTGGVMVSGANKLLGNPTGTTGTAGTSNWQEIGIAANLQFSGSSTLDLAQNIAVTGTMAVTGAATVGSLGTTGAVTGASITVTGAASASSVTTSHVLGGGTVPTVTVNASGCSAALYGSHSSDAAMMVKLTNNMSGGIPTGPMFTVTYANAYATAPMVIFNAANQTAANSTYYNSSNGGTWIDSSASGFVFQSTTGTVLGYGAQHIWAIHVIG